MQIKRKSFPIWVDNSNSILIAGLDSEVVKDVDKDVDKDFNQVLDITIDTYTKIDLEMSSFIVTHTVADDHYLHEPMMTIGTLLTTEQPVLAQL